MPAWRARAHHLTRSRTFLAKAVAVILGMFALIATVMHFARGGEGDGGSSAERPEMSMAARFRATVLEGAHRLKLLREPAPERLIAWIRETADWWIHDEETRECGFDGVALRLATFEVHPLIEMHAVDKVQQNAMEAYVRFLFLPGGEARDAALEELDQIARAPVRTAHANEMLGDALVVSGRGEDALQAFVREVPTLAAKYARVRAMELALKQQDVETLKLLCAEKQVLADINPGSFWKAARQIGDKNLMLQALTLTLIARWIPGTTLLLALLSAAIWYIILVHTASRESMRWWRYLPPVFAGIVSVGLVHWWQGTLNYYQDPEAGATMTHEILRWIMYVGLPEELAKILLFTFFLPVLLHRGSALKAALTAGCVGLGFALHENLSYLGKDPTVAIGRLLTANFVHISLTGIAGLYLYQLSRSKFHRATEFIVAFGAVVVAHGLYDFCTGGAATQWGFNLGLFIILALLARYYLALLHNSEPIRPPGYFVSRSAVFCLGTATLVGMVMVVLVWEMRSLQGITLALEQIVSLALVGLFYLREWHEVH